MAGLIFSARQFGARFLTRAAAAPVRATPDPSSDSIDSIAERTVAAARSALGGVDYDPAASGPGAGALPDPHDAAPDGTAWRQG